MYKITDYVYVYHCKDHIIIQNYTSIIYDHIHLSIITYINNAEQSIVSYIYVVVL